MLSSAGQVLWDQLMWCCNHEQLEDVGRRIAERKAELTLEDLERLRAIYKVRREQLMDPRGGEIRRGDGPVMAVLTVAISMDDFTFARYLRAIQDATSPAQLTAIAKELASLPASQERDTLQRTVRRMLIRGAVEN